VQAGEEAVLLAGRVAQPAQHLKHLPGVDDQHRLPVLEAGRRHGPRVLLRDFSADQLQARRVRH
jgi:hypothetical protein